MAQVFLSHSSRDNEIARELLEWLGRRGFKNTFLDIDKHAGIPPGADWERHLYRKIESSQAVVLIITPNWHESKWCFVEFAQARALGKAIFPLIVAPTGERFIAPDIQQLDLQQDREGGLDRLARELTRLAMDAQAGFAWDPQRPPYPGLMAFEKEDAAVFFGRDDEIRRIIERLNARRVQGGAKVIVLLGASGSGKSSVVRAGVLPRLERDQQNWMVLPPFRPRRHPISEMAKAIAEALGEPQQWRRWNDQLLSPGGAGCLAELADQLRVRVGARESHVLVTIDQGEELFSTAVPQEATQFLAVMEEVSENVPILFLVALRSDFLARLQSSAPSLCFEEVSLPPFPIARIRQVMEGPARIGGIAIDEELVVHASRDVSHDDALPLLAFTLRELYDRFASDRDRAESGGPYLSLAHYRTLGDEAAGLNPLENAVRKRADEVVEDAQLPAAQLDALRQTFVGALVRIDDEGQYLRKPSLWKNVPIAAQPVLEKLAQARLVVVRGTDDAVTVEVAHEALIRKWPRLRAWLHAERDFIVGKAQLRYALDDWQRAGKKEGALLQGLPLSRARQWLRDHADALSEDERHFIEESIALDDRENRRRSVRRWAAIGASAAVLLLTLASGFFFREQQAASVRAEAASLAARARSSLSSGDHLRAASLAAEAFEKSSSVETRSVLLETVLALSPHLVKVRDVSELDASSVAWAPDSTMIAVGGAGSILRWSPFAEASSQNAGIIKLTDKEFSGMPPPVIATVWTATGLAAVAATGLTVDVDPAQEGAIVPRMPSNAEVASAAFSEDGLRMLLAFSGEPDIAWLECRRTSAKSAARCAMTPLASGYARAVALDNRGLTAAIGRDDGKVTILGMGDERFETSRSLADAGSVLSLAWTREGERLAVGTSGGRTIVLNRNGEIVADAFRDEGVITALAWAPSGQKLAATCDRSFICIWQLVEDDGHGQSLQPIAYLAGHKDVLLAIEWSPDGRMIASVSTDGTVRVWSADVIDKTTFALDAGEGVALTALAVSSDRKWVAAGDDRGDVHIWPLDGLAQRKRLSRVNQSRIETLARSPQAPRLAVGDKEGRLSVLESVDQATWTTVTEDAGDVTSMVWLPDGNTILTAGHLDGSIVAYSVNANKAEPFELRHPEAVNGLAVDRKALMLISADSLGNVWRWDLATRARLEPPFPSSGSSRDTVALNPDGRRVLVAGNDGNVVVYNTDRPTEVPIFCRSGSQQLDSAAFAPDGTMVAAVSRDQIFHLWSLTDRCDLLSSAPLPLLAGRSARGGNWPRYRRHLTFLPELHALAITLSTREVRVISYDPEIWLARARGVENTKRH